MYDSSMTMADRHSFPRPWFMALLRTPAPCLHGQEHKLVVRDLPSSHHSDYQIKPADSGTEGCSTFCDRMGSRLTFRSANHCCDSKSSRRPTPRRSNIAIFIGRGAPVYDIVRCRGLGPPTAVGCRIPPPRGQVLDFNLSRPYIVDMTKLLDEAMEAVRRLPSDDQDNIARVMMQLAGSDLQTPVVLSPEEREAIARSKAAAGRGEFATDEQVRAVWAKHGL